MESINIGNCLGIDQHDYSSEYMLISQENYLKYDLRNPLSLTRKYDIAISVEVAEHIDNKYAKIFIGNLCRHSDVILFQLLYQIKEVPDISTNNHALIGSRYLKI